MKTEQDKIVQKIYVLTSRKDLPAKLEREMPNYEGTTVQYVNQPVQSISGKMRPLGIGDSIIRLNDERGMAFIVHADRKNAFTTIPEDDRRALNEMSGKKITLSIADDDKTLTMAVDGGPVIKHEMYGNIPHRSLMEEKELLQEDTGKSFSGTLKGVYGGKLEIHTKDGPTLFSARLGDGPTFSDTTARKMIGKNVELTFNKDCRMQIKSLENDKKLGR